MDDQPVDAEYAPRTSLEKVATTLQELAANPGQLGMLGAMLPLASAALPTDPAELDQYLLMGAKLCLEHRSDDAWEPADFEEFWLGPSPQPEVEP